MRSKAIFIVPRLGSQIDPTYWPNHDHTIIIIIIQWSWSFRSVSQWPCSIVWTYHDSSRFIEWTQYGNHAFKKTKWTKITCKHQVKTERIKRELTKMQNESDFWCLNHPRNQDKKLIKQECFEISLRKNSTSENLSYFAVSAHKFQKVLMMLLRTIPTKLTRKSLRGIAKYRKMTSCYVDLVGKKD